MNKIEENKMDTTPSTRSQKGITENRLPDDQAKKLLAEHLYRLANLSYDTEKEREKKLDDLSVQLLTCITILSVAFLTPASFLFDCYAASNCTGIAPDQVKLAWMYAIVLVPLVVCIILILRARSLKQMKVLDSPESQSDFVKQLLDESTVDNPEYILDELVIAQNYCTAMQGTFEGMREKHDKMWALIKISMILVIISCSCTLFFGLHLLLQLT